MCGARPARSALGPTCASRVPTRRGTASPTHPCPSLHPQRAHSGGSLPVLFFRSPLINPPPKITPSFPRTSTVVVVVGGGGGGGVSLMPACSPLFVRLAHSPPPSLPPSFSPPTLTVNCQSGILTTLNSRLSTDRFHPLNRAHRWPWLSPYMGAGEVAGRPWTFGSCSDQDTTFVHSAVNHSALSSFTFRPCKLESRQTPLQAAALLLRSSQVATQHNSTHLQLEMKWATLSCRRGRVGVVCVGTSPPP